MGSFAEYALAGTCFIVISFWHIVQIFQRYYVCRETGARFNSSLTFSCSCLSNRARYLPVEAYVKIFIGMIGFVVEMIQGFQNGHISNAGSLQNGTVFLLFGVTGFIDFVTSRKTSIPVGLQADYLSNVLAFGLYGFLFWINPQTSSPIVRLLQTLLSYAIFATVLTLLAEMRYRHNVWSSLTRSWLVLCQGTWLWHMGIIQYHPFSNDSSWDDRDLENIALIVTIYTWHIGFNFVLILTIGSVVALRYRHYPSKTNYRVEVKLDNITTEESSGAESVNGRPQFQTSSV